MQMNGATKKDWRVAGYHKTLRTGSTPDSATTRTTSSERGGGTFSLYPSTAIVIFRSISRSRHDLDYSAYLL